MRFITFVALLLVVGGCATLARSGVGPRVAAAYPYASDVTLPELSGSNVVKRRVIRIISGTIRKSTRHRRIRPDADKRQTMIDALGTMVPGQAPMVRR